MKEQIEAYFIRRYNGRIGDELRLAIDLVFGNPKSIELDFDEALSEVCWTFECEWDCGVDDWHTQFGKKAVVE